MNAIAERHVVRLSVQVLFLLAVSVVLELLAVGSDGWLEIPTFYLRGVLVFILLRAGSLAIPPENSSRIGDRLLLCAAASKFVIPFVPHALHVVGTFTALFAGSIGEVVVAKKLLPVSWMPAQTLLRLAQLTVGWSVLITVTANIDTPLGGALERIETVLLLAWIALFAATLRHHALGMMWSRQSTSQLQRAD